MYDRTKSSNTTVTVHGRATREPLDVDARCNVFTDRDPDAAFVSLDVDVEGASVHWYVRTVEQAEQIIDALTGALAKMRAEQADDVASYPYPADWKPGPVAS